MLEIINKKPEIHTIYIPLLLFIRISTHEHWATRISLKIDFHRVPTQNIIFIQQIYIEDSKKLRETTTRYIIGGETNETRATTIVLTSASQNLIDIAQFTRRRCVRGLCKISSSVDRWTCPIQCVIWANLKVYAEYRWNQYSRHNFLTFRTNRVRWNIII